MAMLDAKVFVAFLALDRIEFTLLAWPTIFLDIAAAIRLGHLKLLAFPRVKVSLEKSLETLVPNLRDRPLAVLTHSNNGRTGRFVFRTAMVLGFVVIQAETSFAVSASKRQEV